MVAGIRNGRVIRLEGLIPGSGRSSSIDRGRRRLLSDPGGVSRPAQQDGRGDAYRSHARPLSRARRSAGQRVPSPGRTPEDAAPLQHPRERAVPGIVLIDLAMLHAHDTEPAG
jgi:hypothetical protein